MEPELVADYQCVCGEGPLWHAEEQCVYWVDIPKGRLFRYDPVSGEHEMVLEQSEAIGGFTIQRDGALLLFMNRGAIKIWRKGEFVPVLDELPDEKDTRWNDVIADPEGRVYCGTMAVRGRLGRLYRLDPDRTLTRLLDGIGCSNGMGFTPDGKSLYYTDSPKRELYLFDYDRASGAITNQRVFVASAEEDGVPDGMTVDAEGFVWSAHWGGSCLIRYRPDGTEERRIEFPAKNVSSLTFGGKDFTDIFVTTAGGDDRNAKGPGAGALFRLNAGIAGVAEFRSDVKHV